MFQLFLPSGTFKSVLVRCVFEYCACALSEKLSSRFKVKWLFELFCRSHGTCWCVLTQNAWHLRVRICWTNWEIVKYLVPSYGVFVIFFCLCFVFHILLESKDLKKRKETLNKRRIRAKKSKRRGTSSQGNREKFINVLFWFILGLNNRPFSCLVFVVFLDILLCRSRLLNKTRVHM